MAIDVTCCEDVTDFLSFFLVINRTTHRLCVQFNCSSERLQGLRELSVHVEVETETVIREGVLGIFLDDALETIYSLGVVDSQMRPTSGFDDCQLFCITNVQLSSASDKLKTFLVLLGEKHVLDLREPGGSACILLDVVGAIHFD